MTRINASAAGVTATLANDLITLTSNASSEDAIVVPGESIRTDKALAALFEDLLDGSN
jgi:hypothetical protein